MTIVTALTAARMMAIEAASIVSGAIVGDNLILTRFGGGTVNAGNVRGPIGPPGNPSMPIGSIVAFHGTVAPADWHICNGTTHGSSALQAVSGSAYTPDLRGKFILGVSTSPAHPINQTGGAERVTLTSEESGVRPHGHTGSAMSGDHQHTGSTGGHSQDHSHAVTVGGGTHGHNSSYGNNYQLSPQEQNVSGTVAGPIANTPDRLQSLFGPGEHSHSGQSAGASADHTHAFTTDVTGAHSHNLSVDSSIAAAANNSHQNMPPFYALVYIIKKN